MGGTELISFHRTSELWGLRTSVTSMNSFQYDMNPAVCHAVSPVILVCGSFVESISIVVEFTGARVPIIDVLSGARVPEGVMFSDARVPILVMISGARVPEGVVFSDARVPNVVVIPGAHTPGVVVIPDVRYRAARRFHGLVLAHWRWLEFKFRTQSGWYPCGRRLRVRCARRGSVDLVHDREVRGLTFPQEFREAHVHGF